VADAGGGALRVREIGVRDLARRIAAGAKLLLVDVREPWEHALAALPGSLLIPLGELPERLDEVLPEPATLVVAYCHHGVRSRGAAAILDAAGVRDVVSLAGGIDAWSREVDPATPRY
jgi:rhodanese-related sulfurtransferase